MKYILLLKDMFLSIVRYLFVVIIPTIVVDRIVGGHRTTKFATLILDYFTAPLWLNVGLSLFIYTIPLVVLLFVSVRLMESGSDDIKVMRYIVGVISGLGTLIIVFISTFAAIDILSTCASCIFAAIYGIFILPKVKSEKKHTIGDDFW
ncbi:MAG: hypothetical protein JXA06_08090 [Bacteroidetes bacterium]|nr:hypothetical protein [Bacteroidota bacterium]